MVWPQWTILGGRVWERQKLLTAKRSLQSCKLVSVDRFWHLRDQLTASSVWGEMLICILSGREKVGARERKERGIQQRKGWVMERCVKGWGLLRQKGVYNFWGSIPAWVCGPLSPCRASNWKVSAKVRWNAATDETFYTSELTRHGTFVDRELRCV